MFDRVNRSWALFRESCGVLRQDKELVIFPILSGIFSLLAIASFLVPMILSLPWAEMGQSANSSGSSASVRVHLGPLQYGLLFLMYLVTYFIVIFFNSGLVACVRIRLAGGDPKVSDGFAFATGNIGRIFQWAFISATVGLILRLIEERLDWVGQWIIGLIGLAWSLATMFVVPVLVHERVGPIEAVKRSAQSFRRTWGETVIANFGMSAAFTLLFLAGLPILIGGVAVVVSVLGADSALAIVALLATVGVCIAYWIALAIIQSALQGIFLTACYQYATTGEVPSAFSAKHIAQAWRPKK